MVSWPPTVRKYLKMFAVGFFSHFITQSNLYKLAFINFKYFNPSTLQITDAFVSSVIVCTEM